MGLISDILYTNKNGLFTKKALDIYAQRSLLIGSNIANVETPGYKAVDVKPFEAALKKAYKGGSGIKMAVTNPGHIQAGGKSLRGFQPGLEISQEPGREDGNNVNLDEQMAKMNENLLMYRAVITARSKRGKMISDSIESR